MATEALVPLSATRVPLPSLCVHHAFEQQVRRSPEAVALELGSERLDYAELNARANRLARHLVSLGVAPGERVAVCMRRSLELVTSVVAILKAGGVYVAIDPSYPEERVRFMLADAGVRVLLVDDSAPCSAGVAHLVRPAEHSALELYATDDLDVPASPDAIAYVCYTSGSTGVPKGVEVMHRGVMRLVSGVSYVRLDPSRVLLQAAPAAFDAITFELWGALLHGARCVLLDAAVPSAASLRDAITRHGITTAFLTTALVNAVVDEDALALCGLEQLLFGGEAVSVGHVRRLQEACPNVELIHVYGPTETTTFATAFAIRGCIAASAQTIAIGGPIENTSLYVLDAQRAPVLLGEVGEIYIGGPGVARGYLGRPELTAERFLPDPFADSPDDRMYRTGDLGLLRAPDALEFVGRVDHQVKIRGHRIELGEIEAHLLRLSPVREAVVICREDTPRDKRLVAYVVVQSGSANAAELRAALRESLPDYMVPTHIVGLQRFALTSNGKIDRGALPLPTRTSSGESRRYEPVSGAVEHVLADIWSDLLGVSPVGRNDDFFDLGGHSLLVTRMIARVREVLGVELSLSSVFELRTLTELSRRVAAVDYLRSAPVPESHATDETWI